MCETCNDNCCIISFGCIIDNTPLNTFVDEEEVMNSLLLAQNEIKKEINEECYSQLCQAIAASPGVQIPDEFVKMIEAIRVPLSWLTFAYWLEWYSNVTWADSATTSVTDRNSNSFANISKEQKQDKIIKARHQYDSFLNDALKDIKNLNLDCYVDPDECLPCKNKEVNDETSYLPDVV